MEETPQPQRFRAALQRWTDAILRGLGRLALALLHRLTASLRGQPAQRSLWAGTPILTLPVKARAERLLGVRADTLVYQTYFLSRDFTYDLSPLMRGPRLWRAFVSYLVFVWACLRYQRFHFFCDRGLLPQQGPFQFNRTELAVYRHLGKEVFFYAYGADVRTMERTRAQGEPNCCTECPAPGKACICNDVLGQDNVAFLRQHATAVFSLGDMTLYTPGSRNDLYYWPIDLDRDHGKRYLPIFPDPRSSAPVRIVHAPNHRGFKGTHFLLEAVDQLKAEGVPLELVLVERVPNDRALEIYRSADLIFDQCLIGFHGYFALEAMAMGKPVVVFLRDAERILLRPDECPLVNCTPGTLREVLRRLASDRQGLHDRGVQGRRYIERHYSLPAFARRLHDSYVDLGLPGYGETARRAGVRVGKEAA